WSASVAQVNRFQSFQRGDGLNPLSLDVERRSWLANAVYRIGGGANGLFAGAQVSGDRVVPAGSGVVITDTGFVDDPDTTLGSGYGTRTSTMASAIVGVRALRF